MSLKYLLTTGFLVLASLMSAQTKFGAAEFDKTVHDFGDVLLSDGPQKCVFTFRNTGGKAMVVYSVISSCGCTDVSWTREPVLPGKTGSISVTYSNDEGPYPFDKSLTVYISDVEKPVILKVRGVSRERKLSLEESYGVRYGSFAMKTNILKCGNLEQGERKSSQVNVANLSSRPLNITFEDVSKGLSIKVTPNPVPARGTASMQFTVTADRDTWGKNYYYASPMVDGKRYPMTGKPASESEKVASYEGNLKENTGKIAVYAFTKENFGSLSQAEKNAAPRPMFRTSTYSFGKIRRGTAVDAVFSFENAGKQDFKVYKVDIDAPDASCSGVPVVGNKGRGEFSVHLDTSSLPLGETLVIVTLTTNSPSRPIINLFISGWLE